MCPQLSVATFEQILLWSYVALMPGIEEFFLFNITRFKGFFLCGVHSHVYTHGKIRLPLSFAWFRITRRMVVVVSSYYCFPFRISLSIFFLNLSEERYVHL